MGTGTGILYACPDCGRAAPLDRESLTIDTRIQDLNAALEQVGRLERQIVAMREELDQFFERLDGVRDRLASKEDVVCGAVDFTPPERRWEDN